MVAAGLSRLPGVVVSPPVVPGVWVVGLVWLSPFGWPPSPRGHAPTTRTALHTHTRHTTPSGHTLERHSIRPPTRASAMGQSGTPASGGNLRLKRFVDRHDVHPRQAHSPAPHPRIARGRSSGRVSGGGESRREGRGRGTRGAGQRWSSQVCAVRCRWRDGRGEMRVRHLPPPLAALAFRLSAS